MFYGFVITEAGNRLLARQVAGDHLDISRVVMDKGTCESAEEAIKLTAPIDPGPNGVHTVPVCVDSNVNFIVEYRSDLNGGLKEDFWIGGFAVYVRNPAFSEGLPLSEDNPEDEVPEEIMVYYGTLGDAKQKVKAYVPGSVPDVRRYPVSIAVTSGVIPGSAHPAEAWMTAEDVKNYVMGTLNPELRAALTVLIEAHDQNEQAHEGMRELAEQAKEESAEALQVANAASATAGAAKTTADAALEAAMAAGNTAAGASETATDALNLAQAAKTESEAAVAAAAAAQATADAAAKGLTDLTSTINAVPSQNGILFYTGSTQSPSWNSFDTEKLTLGGTTTGTNAGSYQATFTPKEGFKWSDGTTTAKTVSWTISKATIQVPAQSGSLAYTGAELSPGWTGYDSAKMTLGGTTKGTNVGSYSASFTPKANYQWPDGSSAAKTVSWSIGKAAGSLSLNVSSMALSSREPSKQIVVTRTGDGAISASSSNTSIATVSVSGNTVTVTGKANGSATITVKVAAGTNHNAPANKTCSVSVSFEALAGTSAASGVSYTSGLGSITQAKLSAYAKAISNNSGITKTTTSVYIDDGASHFKLSVGDTVNISLGGTSYAFVIIGFNHDTLASATAYGSATATGKAGISLQMKDCLNTTYQMNSSNTNSGGWGNCALRTTLQNTIKGQLPSAWQSIIKTVTKKASAGSTSSTISSYSDTLFLLAEVEIFGSTTYSAVGEGDQYAWYKAGNSKVKKVNGSANDWWERSPYATYSNYFCSVYSSGGANTSYANSSRGVAFGFCV